MGYKDCEHCRKNTHPLMWVIPQGFPQKEYHCLNENCFVNVDVSDRCLLHISCLPTHLMQTSLSNVLTLFTCTLFLPSLFPERDTICLLFDVQVCVFFLADVDI